MARERSGQQKVLPHGKAGCLLKDRSELWVAPRHVLHEEEPTTAQCLGWVDRLTRLLDTFPKGAKSTLAVLCGISCCSQALRINALAPQITADERGLCEFFTVCRIA